MQPAAQRERNDGNGPTRPEKTGKVNHYSDKKFQHGPLCAKRRYLNQSYATVAGAGFKVPQ
jgi:hypothetical protein